MPGNVAKTLPQAHRSFRRRTELFCRWRQPRGDGSTADRAERSAAVPLSMRWRVDHSRSGQPPPQGLGQVVPGGCARDELMAPIGNAHRRTAKIQAIGKRSAIMKNILQTGIVRRSRRSAPRVFPVTGSCFRQDPACHNRASEGAMQEETPRRPDLGATTGRACDDATPANPVCSGRSRLLRRGPSAQKCCNHMRNPPRS